MNVGLERLNNFDVDRLIVRNDRIVSDTRPPWEQGCEEHRIARGSYAWPAGEGKRGLWVRSRPIKGEVDNPFDDRFHAQERKGPEARQDSLAVAAAAAYNGPRGW